MGAVKICPQCGQQFEGDTLFCPRDGSALRPASETGVLVGHVVADRYLVLEELGHGGMGQVYLAEHVKIGRRCALKVIKPALVSSADAVMRFNREAANASRIAHPNVVQVYDFGESSDGLIFFAMEFVEGAALATLLQAQPALPPRRAAAIALQVADALGAAHDLRIVHRDLKPENVMLARHRDGSDFVKVVDFGVSRIMEDDTQKVTSTGMVIGTLEYMSPEQFTGEPVDGRSDVYSLGILLFRMWTGKLPFHARNALEAMEARVLTGLPRLADIHPEVAWPRSVQDVLDTAMTAQPDQRYADVGAFAADLEAAVVEWLPDDEHAVSPWDVRLRGGSSRSVEPGTSGGRRAQRAEGTTVPLALGNEGARGVDAGQTAPRSSANQVAHSSLLPVPPIHIDEPDAAGASSLTSQPAPRAPAQIAPGAAMSSWPRGRAMAAGLGILGLIALITIYWPSGETSAPTNPAQRAIADSASVDPRRPDAAVGERKSGGDTLEPGASRTNLGRNSGAGTKGSDPQVQPIGEPIEIRRALDRVEVLTDTGATPDQAREALRILSQLAPRTHAGLVEARYRAFEANVKLDRTAEVCRLYAELKDQVAGTRFENAVRLFAAAARTACPVSLQPDGVHTARESPSAVRASPA